MTHASAPIPDLRIVDITTLHPHEDHDSQRSGPLIARLQRETTIINPPLAAPMGLNEFVILDGANRVTAFKALEYPHLLIQVASYNTSQVELSTWSHVVCSWTEAEFTQLLYELPSVRIKESQDAAAIAHVIFPDQRVLSISAALNTLQERNAALRQIVAIYQQRAVLQRTALVEPREVFLLHPDGIALVVFPTYTPADIIEAARHHAYLPPGVSRHVVHGRAIRVNYPLERLRDPNVPLRQKNADLFRWMQDKLAQRQVRYYAESTYQFDE